MSGDETNALSLEQQNKPGTKPEKPMKLTNPQFIHRAFSGGIAAAASLTTNLRGPAAPITERHALVTSGVT